MAWDLGIIEVHGKAGKDMGSSNSFDKFLEQSGKTYETGLGKSSSWNLGGLFGGITKGISWGKVALCAGAIVLLVLVIRRK